MKIGNEKKMFMVKDFLSNFLIKNKYSNKLGCKVFSYITNSNQSFLVSSVANFKEINLINFHNIFIGKNRISNIKALKYVENGISFRGLDV